MNKIILMGRLTRDPSVRYTIGDKPIAVANFVIAVDRKYKSNGEKQTDFISCVAFNKTAEFVEKYLKQGIKIVLDGSIQTGNYVNKEGAKIYTTTVNAENIEFAESKKSTNNVDADGFMNIPDGVEMELPFV